VPPLFAHSSPSGICPSRDHGHHLSLYYQPSIEPWGPWFWDWTKAAPRIALALPSSSPSSRPDRSNPLSWVALPALARQQPALLFSSGASSRRGTSTRSSTILARSRTPSRSRVQSHRRTLPPPRRHSFSPSAWSSWKPAKTKLRQTRRRPALAPPSANRHLGHPRSRKPT